MDYIVEMNGITKKFPGIVANSDITVKIKQGEIYALLGENGAGKSTLMSMLFGLYEPDEGEIKIRGEAVRITDPNVASDLKIGMVHQHFKLIHNFTVAENIMLGNETLKYIFYKPIKIPVFQRQEGENKLKSAFRKTGHFFKRLGIRIANGFTEFFSYVDRKGVEKTVEEISERYGLKVNPHALISDINVSSQQRVEILKMLYKDADILIFDEPTAVLTPQEIESLIEVIKELRAHGKTIIIITHKLEEIKKMADRCAVLRLGKLIDVVDIAKVDEKQLAALMVGRDVVFTTDKAKKEQGEALLDVKNLTVLDSHKFPRVNNVSLTVHSGEILALAGVSDNGQIELADAICGLKRAHEGQITICGKDVTTLSVRERGAYLSYIPEDRQNVGLILDFDLAKNLTLRDYYKPQFCKRGILKYKAFDERSRDLIKKYDIRSALAERTVVRSMSGGNQQKAIIAREIERDTDVMVFVQPTRGLDVGAIEGIHHQIIAERDKGKAILLISLELEEIMNLADTIAVIYNGEILKTLPADSATIEDVGRYMMGIRDSESTEETA